MREAPGNGFAWGFPGADVELGERVFAITSASREEHRLTRIRCEQICYCVYIAVEVQ